MARVSHFGQLTILLLLGAFSYESSSRVTPTPAASRPFIGVSLTSAPVDWTRRGEGEEECYEEENSLARSISSNPLPEGWLGHSLGSGLPVPARPLRAHSVLFRVRAWVGESQADPEIPRTDGHYFSPVRGFRTTFIRLGFCLRGVQA